MNIPDNLRYTTEHEWIKVEGQYGWVGITDFAQSELGDIVYIDVFDKSKKVERGKTFATVEAVKAVSDIFAPVTGEIVEVNKELKEHPEIINKDPYGAGWIVKLLITDPGELDLLMDAEAYRKHIGK